MSSIIVVTVFETVNPVVIDDLDVNQLNNISSQLETCIKEKLSKLSLYFSHLDVSSKDGLLIIHDEYNIYRDLSDIMKSFGLDVIEISNKLPGRLYLVKDYLFELLNYIKDESLTDLFGIKRFTSNQLDSHIKNNKYELDSELFNLIKEIKDRGLILRETKKVVERTEVFESGILYSTSDKVMSVDQDIMLDQIHHNIEKFKMNLNETYKRYNVDMVEGTKQIVRSRAKSMGYDVKEVKQGSKTQMVLVKWG